MTPWRTAVTCTWFLTLSAITYGQGLPAHPIDPDRPDLTNTAQVVDPGFVQFEAGGIFTRESDDRRVAGAPLGIRIGLRNWIEARVGFDNLLVRAVDDAGRQTGIGNLQLGAKIRVWPDTDGQSLLSLLPSVNLPTASEEKGLGSGGADFTLTVLTAVELNPRAQVGINYVVGAIAAEGGAAHFVQHVGSASLGLTVTDHWNPYFEMSAISRNRLDGSPVVAINMGTLYVIGRRLALDGGVQVGLTEDASAFSAFGGFSVAVGIANTRGSQRRAAPRQRWPSRR